MSDTRKVTFMKQEYEHSETGEKVPGITVIIDGAFREICDKLIAESGMEQDYTKLIQEALFRGINSLIEENKAKQADKN